jgi:TolB-like protein
MFFWGELKRRNVVKVGLAYVVVGWLVIQMVTTVMPTFNAPAWIAQSITFVLILGSPFVLVFAWAFEITPEGLKKTSDVAPEQSITSRTSQRLNYTIIGLLVVAIAFMAVDDYLFDDPAARDQAQAVSRTEAAPPQAGNQPPVAVEPQTLPNSVAVIPFTNLSPREDEAYFAAGIHDEILNQLVKLSGLNVIARTSVMQYAGTSKTIPEIGRELNVENVMEGSVRYADGRVLVTTQLIDAETGVHVWSESYERPFENIFGIQADIAMNVANALETAFTPAEQENIERLPTDSLEAYELYLSAQQLYRDGAGGATLFRGALEAIDKALALDPEFARAWVTKADIHGIRAQAASGNQYAAEQDAMLQAALRAAELEPNLTEAQVHVATAKSRAADWNAAESAYRRAYAAQPNVAAPRYAVHLLGAGQLEKARELTSIARATDPLNRTVRGFNILASALTGDQAAADSDYERATATYGGGQWIGSWFITMSRLEPGRALRLEAIPSFNAPPLNQQAREHFSSPAEGLAVLRERWAGPELGTSELLVVGVWAAYFGDAPFALEALEVAIKRNAQNALNLWLPSARELRQLPRFKAFVAEIGLVDYWRQYGWPDLCRPLGAEDFTCG